MTQICVENAKVARPVEVRSTLDVMQMGLRLLNDVLVAMFLVGGVGSAFVIVISFAEDMRELFNRDE